MKAIADTLGVARSNLLVQARREHGASLAPGTRSARSLGCERRDGRRSADAELLAEIRPYIDARTTYGYRRADGMVNRQRLSDGRPAVPRRPRAGSWSSGGSEVIGSGPVSLLA